MQHDQFLHGEADNWYERNREDLINKYSGDYMSQYLLGTDLQNKKVLDVGCGHGDRLNELSKHGAQCWGIEPSQLAVDEASKMFPQIEVSVGVSHDLARYAEASFDIVTVAFVFHWVDRARLLQTVSEIDRVLKDGGTLLIMDFFPDVPHRREYHHNLDLGVYTFKQIYADMFTASNIYTELDRVKFKHPDGVHYDWHQRDDSLTGGDRDGMLVVLQKDLLGNYPVRKV